MAIIQCGECGNSISDLAAACPHCGAPGPAAKTAAAAPAPTPPTPPPTKEPPKQYGCGTLIVLCVFALIIFRACSPSTTSDTSAPAPPKLSDAECKKDLQCWGDRHNASATISCKRAVEGLAKWQAEWTDSFLESKFDRFSWGDQARGTLWYHGNKIKMQNGFGAWQNKSYRCLFDPSSERVLDVKVL